MKPNKTFNTETAEKSSVGTEFNAVFGGHGFS
jgi:hypothetical protein